MLNNNNVKKLAVKYKNFQCKTPYKPLSLHAKQRKQKQHGKELKDIKS